MKTMTQARVVVSGRVQGVFFPASTCDVASRCGVRGYVRNLPGRQVEAVLQGERSAVEKVIAFLREGPPGAGVTDIAVGWGPPADPPPGENKPLSPPHRGRPILSIGSVGCNFHCGFCQNYHLVECSVPLSPMPIHDLVRAARREGAGGSSYTYNEPLIGVEFVSDCAR